MLAFAILVIASSVTPVFAQYTRTDLASNQQGVAPSTDQQQLINSWGLTALPTGPWWLSDNGSGFSTLYNGDGQLNPLLVSGLDDGPNGLHNQLFFTGGPNGYANGIFGVITFGQ